MQNQSEEKKSLIKEVHEVFGDIPFPEHCGWNAAMAKDDWIDDPTELKRITDEKDIKGKWWKIPSSELDNMSLAQCYLDSKGVEFYLPACLVIVLNDETKRKYQSLIYWFEPPQKDDKDDLYPYFLDMFSRINKPQKKVCMRILQYIDTYLVDPRVTITKDAIDRTLKHEFWKS